MLHLSSKVPRASNGGALSCEPFSMLVCMPQHIIVKHLLHTDHILQGGAFFIKISSKVEGLLLDVFPGRADGRGLLLCILKPRRKQLDHELGVVIGRRALPLNGRGLREEAGFASQGL